ncbi:MAG: AraC family transcriptional regulator [Candidatus Izimaplasma sp.]|nr:AraC family transcriptional regulator [Candidatus Izimaplasma bacterium]
MKVKNILESEHFQLISDNLGIENEVNGIFSCDLLSHVMGFANEKNILITVLNNINVLGVASLLDLSCVIFSHNIQVNESIISKANDLDIPLIRTKLSTSETVISLYQSGVNN